MTVSLAQLQQGLAELSLSATQQQQQQLLDYLQLLIKWNKAYNLTAIRDPQAMLVQHLLDSLVILPHVPEGRLLDVGTGAGLPGLLLAIMQPQRAVTLLDSNGKKTRFLQQAVHTLGLSRVEVVHSRVEDYQPPQLFQVIVSRAYAAMATFTIQCEHLCAPEGRFLAMKGVYPTDELADLAASYHVQQVHELQVPGLAAQRHLVVLTLG